MTITPEDAIEAKNRVINFCPLSQDVQLELVRKVFPDIKWFYFSSMLSPWKSIGKVFWMLTWYRIEAYQIKLATMTEEELREHIKYLKIRINNSK